MSSSTSSSEELLEPAQRVDAAGPARPERSRAQRFLVLFAMLAFGVEGGFAILGSESLGRHEVDDCVHAVTSFAVPPRAVLLSDSVSYGVLDAVRVPPDLLDLSNNQTIAAAGNYFLLRRLAEELDRRGASGPAFIVIAMNPVSWDSNLDSPHFLEPYFASVFRRPDEIESIRSTLGRSDLVRAMRDASLANALQLPSYLRRGLVQAPVRRGLRELKRDLQERMGAAVNEAPGGTALWAEAAHEKIEERAALERFLASPVTEAYLPRIAALCAERGTRLVLVPSPLPPTVRAAWRANGYWRSYLDALTRLTAAHPALVLPACPWQAPSDDLFYDGVHLVQSGKNTWGAALAELLADPEPAAR